MRTIAFLSQKGGSGKTTLAVHTAVAAQESGEEVVVIDTDPQKSAFDWTESRPQTAKPVVVAVGSNEIPRVLKAAAADKMTLAIVDSQPHASPAVAQVARGVGFVVIPCQPSSVDLRVVKNAVAIVEAAKVRAAFVLSECPSKMPEVTEARQVLETYGFPVCPVEIGQRRAFVRAMTTGKAVTEFESSGKAAEEIRALWAWLKEQTE